MNRNDTKMIQGLSVLAMVCLHLFNTWDYAQLFVPLIYIKGIPLCFYISLLCDFCVTGFAFCSGYGHYKQHEKHPHYYKERLKGLLSLYVNFWIVLLLFTAVSCIAGKSDFMPGNVWTFIKTFTTISPAYNGAWWYLPVYAVIVIASPLILKFSKKCNTVVLSVLTVIIYCGAYLLRFRFSTGNEYIDWFGPFGTTLAEYMLGVILCKICFFEKLSLVAKKINKYVLCAGSVVLIVAMLFFRTLVVPSLAVAPITGMIIISIFYLWKKPKFVEKFFLFIGRHSTNIWLTHMFFYLVLFKNFVFIAKYPPLIFLLMLAITVAVSYIINFIHKPIKKCISKI